MVVVKIELWRRGNPDDVVDLGRIEIVNVGCSPGGRKGNYAVRFFGRRGVRNDRRDVLHFDFPRLRLTAFHLLRRVLSQAGY